MADTATGRLTQRKDLHDARSLWADSPGRTVPTQRDVRDLACDIVVVGGGISGALIALTLSAAGHVVVVVDRRPPGAGSTLASTAMIQFEIDTPLTDLAAQIGKTKAERAYLRSAKAVKDLGRLIDTYEIQADWFARDALYLAGEEQGFRKLKAEAEARQAIGLPSEFIKKSDLRTRFGIDRTGAILSKASAELDPAKTAAGALRAARTLGAKVISPCDIVAVESSGSHVRLKTSAGRLLTCRKAVFATGYEVIDGIPRDAFKIVSSWAIATKPISDADFWPTRCLIWEAADPYLYVRSTADNRVLAGGEDSGLIDPERRAAAIPRKSEKLIGKVRKLLDRPELEIDYAWAGAFADSPTGLPVFKELPHLPNVFAVLGCGGNGITFSMIAADVVKAWVDDKTDPDAGLFSGAEVR